MKKQLLFLLLFASISFNSWAQSSISFTSVPSSTQVGTNLVVNYKYTAPAAGGKVAINISKNGGTNPYDYISNVIYAELTPTVAGTNITGSFTLAIPFGTTPTSSLTGNQNYRIKIELYNASNTFLAGNYDYINYNFTASTVVVPAISLTSVPSSTQVGNDLTVNYKYTTAAAGGKVAFLVSKNGGVNPWDYIGTVAYTELTSAAIGTDVTGSFTVPIPAETTPTKNLTGNQNYRITIEIFNSSNTWLAGNYDYVDYNFEPSLGVNDFDYNKLSVYPNPVDTILKIDNSSNLSNASYRILNVSGQTVQKSSSLYNEGIDVSGLNTGVYMLSVDSDEGSKQFKFIKK